MTRASLLTSLHGALSNLSVPYVPGPSSHWLEPLRLLLQLPLPVGQDHHQVVQRLLLGGGLHGEVRTDDKSSVSGMRERDINDQDREPYLEPFRINKLSAFFLI